MRSLLYTQYIRANIDIAYRVLQHEFKLELDLADRFEEMMQYILNKMLADLAEKYTDEPGKTPSLSRKELRKIFGEKNIPAVQRYLDECPLVTRKGNNYEMPIGLIQHMLNVLNGKPIQEVQLMTAEQFFSLPSAPMLTQSQFEKEVAEVISLLNEIIVALEADAKEPSYEEVLYGDRTKEKLIHLKNIIPEIQSAVRTGEISDLNAVLNQEFDEQSLGDILSINRLEDKKVTKSFISVSTKIFELRIKSIPFEDPKTPFERNFNDFSSLMNRIIQEFEAEIKKTSKSLFWSGKAHENKKLSVLKHVFADMKDAARKGTFNDFNTVMTTKFNGTSSLGEALKILCKLDKIQAVERIDRKISEILHPEEFKAQDTRMEF